MLTNKDLSIAEQLVQAMGGQVKVSVRPNTPLARLMDVSIGGDGSDITRELSMAGTNIHDIEVGNLIELGDQYLKASLARARSGALPIINDLVDLVNTKATSRTIELTEFTIVPRKQPALYDVPSFMSLALVEGEYMETLRSDLPSNMLPSIDFEAAMEHIKTGVEKIDAAAEADGLTPAFCQYAYSTIGDDLINKLDMHVEHKGEVFPALLVVLINCLLNKEEKLDIELSATVRVYLQAVLYLLSGRIKQKTARRERNFEKGTLILGISGRCITVNNDVYKKYLTNGGRPEVIMGAAIDNALITLATAKEDGDRYLDIYDGFIKRSAVQAKSMRGEIIRKLLPSEFVDYLNDGERSKEEMSELVPYINSAMEQVTVDTADIYPAVRQLVCNVMYPKSDTLKVLSRIDDLMKQNPDMDAADAATACYTSILTEFYVNQLIIEKV